MVFLGSIKFSWVPPRSLPYCEGTPLLQSRPQPNSAQHRGSWAHGLKFGWWLVPKRRGWGNNQRYLPLSLARHQPAVAQKEHVRWVTAQASRQCRRRQWRDRPSWSLRSFCSKSILGHNVFDYYSICLRIIHYSFYRYLLFGIQYSLFDSFFEYDP